MREPDARRNLGVAARRSGCHRRQLRRVGDAQVDNDPTIWKMKTSDLTRGLVGHLFNGYSEEHVKDELKPVMARFRSAETQAERCTLDGPRPNDDELSALGRAFSRA
jgi:hypothetical protein